MSSPVHGDEMIPATGVVALSPVALAAGAAPSAPLHVAVETAAALISLLAAQLMLGRYARSILLPDLLLGAALIVLAFGNLALSAIPAILEQERGPLATWGALAVR